MSYTVAFGENDHIVISLDRIGREYSVSIWDREEHKFSLFEKFDSMTDACLRFFRICRDHNLEHHKVEHDISDFANID